MKNYLLILFLSFSWFLQAQDFPNFTGSYKSFRTSFLDFNNPNESFNEDAEYQILVILEEEGNGLTLIVDPRIPDNPLTYHIKEFDVYLPWEENDIFIFKAISLTTGNELNLVFYFNKDDSLKLMVDYDQYNQFWHDLEFWEDVDYWEEYFKE